LFGSLPRARAAGELLAWSRILSDEEALCVVNTHGTQRRGADVLIDADLNADGARFTVVANGAEAAQGSAAGVSHPVGSTVAVRRDSSGVGFVEVRDVPPSGVVVLVNRP